MVLYYANVMANFSDDCVNLQQNEVCGTITEASLTHGKEV